MDQQGTSSEALQRDIEIFKIVTEHFRQDVREFWTKANFYLVTQAGLLSAFIVAHSALIEGGSLIALTIPLAGLAMAILWFIVLRGSIYFIQMWREQAIRIDRELDRFACYANVEGLTDRRRLSSPSYVTQFLPLLFAVVWFSLFLVVFCGT